MEPIAQSARMKKPTHGEFGLRVTLADRRHDPAPRFYAHSGHLLAAFQVISVSNRTKLANRYFAIFNAGFQKLSISLGARDLRWHILEDTPFGLLSYRPLPLGISSSNRHRADQGYVYAAVGFSSSASASCVTRSITGVSRHAASCAKRTTTVPLQGLSPSSNSTLTNASGVTR